MFPTSTFHIRIYFDLVFISLVQHPPSASPHETPSGDDSQGDRFMCRTFGCGGLMGWLMDEKWKSEITN